MLEIELLVPYKMIRIFAVIFLLIDITYSQRYPNNEVNKLLDVGIEYIVNQNYDLAKVKFNLLHQKYPDLPLGKIYLAVVDITKALDYGEELEESTKQNLDEAIELSENLLDKNPSNKWHHYFSALSKGYKAYFKVLDDQMLSAIPSVLGSIQNFEDCLEIDSSFYESYFALGTYKFWRSRKLEFLEWLPFIDDESEKGIKYLELALEKTSYSKNLTALSLIWIYIDVKNYSGAIQIADQELKKNPINRPLKWALARAYEEVNPRKAIQIYTEIINSYDKLPNNNHYNEITLKHLIAQQLSKIGEKREALRLCEEILVEQNLTEKIREKLSDRLNRVKRMKKELIN